MLEYDSAQFSRGAQYVILPDGSRVATPLTLYVRGTETDVPSEADRVTLSDDRAFIVMERVPVSGLRRARTAPDHYRLRCKKE